MDMVERMARAICKELNSTFVDPEPEIIDRHWPKYKDAARAAIEALREPTDRMVRALYDEFGELWAENEARAVWRTMNDAALRKAE